MTNIADSVPTHGWPAPDYENPDTRSWLPIFLFSIHGVATLLVAVRLGLRLRKEAGGFGVDDAFLLPAWLLCTGFVSFASWSSLHGVVDRHVWDVPPTKVWQLPLSAWVGSMLFVLGTGSIKVSVLLFYRRLGAQAIKRNWKYATWAAIAFTVAYTITLVFLLIFNCSPTQAYWRSYDPLWQREYHCLDTKVINPLAGVFSMGSDIYSVVLPCIMCRKLQIPWRQKLALNLVFCTGVFVVAASALRTWALTALGTDSDVTWGGFWVFFWGGMEFDLGIICTCLPALRVLFKRQLRDTARETSSASRGPQSSSYDAKCTGPLEASERPAHSRRHSASGEVTKHPWSRLWEEKYDERFHGSTMAGQEHVGMTREVEQYSLSHLQRDGPSYGRSGAWRQ